MIYLDNPNIGESEMLAVQIAMSEGNISTVGPYVTEFENAIAEYLGGGVSCIATNSGTSALYIALKILGIGPGDEVILPAITFVATANAIKMAGAEAVFVDIDPNTWNIDPIKVFEAITQRTKAIISVHLYGNPCDIEALFYNNHYINRKIYIIEDACESLGATYNGQHMGTIGDIGCLSFNRNKIITTGGGGMLIIKDPDLAERVRIFINQGRDKTGQVVEPGFNFGMINQNAALGLEQFKKLDIFLSKKHEIRFYCGYELSELEEKEIIDFQNTDKNVISNYWLTSIKINTQKVGKTIPQIQKELKAKEIPTRRIFEPLASLSNSIDLYENGLCLPSSTLNTYEDIKYVTESLLEILNIK